MDDTRQAQPSAFLVALESFLTDTGMHPIQLGPLIGYSPEMVRTWRRGKFRPRNAAVVLARLDALRLDLPPIENHNRRLPQGRTPRPIDVARKSHRRLPRLGEPGGTMTDAEINRRNWRYAGSKEPCD